MHLSSKESSKCRLRDYLPVIIMAVCIAVASIYMIKNDITVDDIYKIVELNKATAAIIIVILFALKGVVAVIWYSALVALSGFVFGFPLGFLINSIGTVLCLSVSYVVGYNTKTDYINVIINKHKKIKCYINKCETNSFFVSYLLHAMGLSTEALGVVFGFMKMPYFRYVLSSYIAMAPGMLCVTIFGQKPDVSSPAFWIAALVEATVIVTAYIFGKRLIKRA